MLWKRGFLVIYCLLWVMFLWAPAAEAYLDPGAGSYMCQMFLAAILGAAFVIKVYWHRIQAVLAGWFSRNPGARV